MLEAWDIEYRHPKPKSCSPALFTLAGEHGFGCGAGFADPPTAWRPLCLIVQSATTLYLERCKCPATPILNKSNSTPTIRNP